jgi:hypothetical protein
MLPSKPVKLRETHASQKRAQVIGWQRFWFIFVALAETAGAV